MREADAQAVLLVRAFEEVDVAGRLLTVHERSLATEKAREAARDDEQRLVRDRARTLLGLLDVKVPHIPIVLSMSRIGAGIGRGLVAIAFVVGLSANVLGPDQRINVLATPLLLLLLWNLGTYVVIAVWRWRAWSRRRASRAGVDATGDTAASESRSAPLGAAVIHEELIAKTGAARGWIGRAAHWLVERSLRRPQARRVQDQQVVVDALARYASTWHATSVDLVASRLRLLLHLGAIALVAGTVVEMYVRGLGLEYRVHWESTFLSAGQVDGLLGFLLGPAARVLGVSIVSVDTFAGEAGGDAAPWIHLYAVTSLLWVFVPRSLLAGWEWLRIHRLTASLPLDMGAPYFRRLLAPERGRAVTVDVLPYSHRTEARATDALKVLLHDLFGVRADIRMAASLEYGAEADEITPPDDPGRTAGQGFCAVVLFSLAQSPESEVHGRLVEEIRPTLREGEQMLVVVDGSTYRERVGDATHRLDERRRAWERVVKEAGQLPVHVDLGRPPPDDVLERMGAAIWPPEAGP